jgi:hemerythrin-like domain-containing protein
MIEHRLIERMIKLMDAEVGRITATGRLDPLFIATTVDFFRTYTDRCHHGKEEDILFAELAKRSMTDELKQMMADLISEHAWARAQVQQLVAGTARYAGGDQSAVPQVNETLRKLAAFYPQHIHKEDKQFFIPAMGYLSKEEQDQMLNEFFAFDRKLFHDKYTEIVDSLQQRSR